MLWLRDLIKSPVARMGMIALMVASWAYFKGRDDCADRHARRASKEAAAWAEKVEAARVEAYAKGSQAAKIETKNEKTVDQIVRDAGLEAGSDDLCLSESVLDKIRAIQ